MGIEALRLDALGESTAQRLGTVHLQQLMQLIDVPDPVPWPAMDDLGQVDQGR